MSESLSPPRPKFVLDAGQDNAEPEQQSSNTHHYSRSQSSSADSPPMTPRSQTFAIHANPFSPPGSIRSFGPPDGITLSPGIQPQQAQVHYPFPEKYTGSAAASTTTSTADLPRLNSYYAARPATTDSYQSAFSPRSSTGRIREAFTSPPQRPLTIYGSSPAAAAKRARPKSTMLNESVPLSKPWLQSRDPYARIAYFVTYSVVLVGLVAGALNAYFGWKSIPMVKGNLCLVFDEDFSNGEDGLFGDNGKFLREVDMSGFGNGEFEMTTASENNSFVKDGHLYIMPTLTSDALGIANVLNGYTFNITGCTFNETQGISYTSSSLTDPTSENTTVVGSDQSFDAAAYYKACSAVSNQTLGTIINPVQSARLSTRKTGSIRYGRVEVVAKIPTGDWMWPAIWMLPVDSQYGSWPLSGEIDIMEARGNGPRYPAQGTNYVRGSLNWGPFLWLNAVSKTFGWWTQRRGSYDQGFHTYALEWTEDFIRIYVDTRLHHMLDLSIKEPFFELGDFPPVIQNGSETIVLPNPWVNGTKAAPFDQPFYLILDVGIGGTNGWFPDNVGSKPWLDGSLSAARDFITAQDEWYPTWPQDPDKRAMVIDSVKMYQQC